MYSKGLGIFIFLVVFCRFPVSSYFIAQIFSKESYERISNKKEADILMKKDIFATT